MKFSRFFTLLAARLLGPKGTPRQLQQTKREFVKDPVLRRIAHNAGNQRRLDAHRQSCEQSYAEKRRLVQLGKGRNTLAGIPAAAV